jgi:anthranilate phosphoribosyltransferase
MPTYNLIDIVGTGGDGAATFNISTAVAFVVAAAGGHVAKHGNRSISSPSGSADMIEQAGINLNLTPDKIQQCIEQIGIGFLFAPQHHPALQHAKQARKELGIRTFLNLLGPLTNPANATSLVVGVFAPKWLEVLAKVLINLGCQHAAIVHSEDGLDEISIAAPTQVAEVKSGKIYQYHITPEQYGFRRQSLDPIRVQSPAQSLNIVQSVLNDFKGPALDIVLLNAGMALYVAEMVNSIDEGIGKAKEVIASGKALEKLQQLAAFSHTFD